MLPPSLGRRGTRRHDSLGLLGAARRRTLAQVASPVRVDANPPVARITLDRPDRRNALGLDALTALDAALRKLSGDASCRVVVIAGAGPVFSSGHDIAEMQAGRGTDYFERLFGECVDVMRTIRAAPQPVIARVHGVATAAGCQLVAACDLAVAAASARFATPGVDIGLFCSTPMVPVTRAIGRKRALEMLLTAEMIDAPTAAQWGLVNRVVPDDELDAAVDSLTATIASKSPAVVALGKRTFYEQDGLTEDAAYGVALPAMVRNAMFDDADEGMAAFLEKRPPHWPGT
jgi:enoyl-CoA hydratase/carnithine racemase